MEMHGYLTVPEPVDDDVPWLTRLFHEASRAMAKSAFHQGSHFFDHNTINRPKPPPTI